MIKNTNSFIREPIHHYLVSVVELFQTAPLPVSMYPLVDTALSKCFVDMKGCLEQKLYCLALRFIEEDGELKYNNFHGGAFKGKLLESLFNEIKEIISDISNGKNKIEYDLWKNYNILQKSYFEISNIFQDKNILNYIGGHFTLFEHYFDCLGHIDEIEKLDQIKQKIKSVKKNPGDYSCAEYQKIIINVLTNVINRIECHSKMFDKLKNTQKFKNDTKTMIQYLYDSAEQYRNAIAHNTKSATEQLPNIYNMADEKYEMENMFSRFMMLVYVDMIFMDMFDKYQKTKTQYF